MTRTTTLGTGFEQLRTAVQANLLARMPDHIERLRWSREQIEASQREGLRASPPAARRHRPRPLRVGRPRQPACHDQGRDDGVT